MESVRDSFSVLLSLLFVIDGCKKPPKGAQPVGDAWIGYWYDGSDCPGWLDIDSSGFGRWETEATLSSCGEINKGGNATIKNDKLYIGKHMIEIVEYPNIVDTTVGGAVIWRIVVNAKEGNLKNKKRYILTK